METRELFWSLSPFAIAAFYVVATLAILSFLFGTWQHFDKYRKAKGKLGPIDIKSAIKRLFHDLATHRTVRRRDPLAGYAHAAIFTGFLIALVATTIITIDHDITKPLFGFEFWHGKFYLFFSLIVDLGGLALLIGLCIMGWRRWVTQPKKLDYVRAYKGETQSSEQQNNWRFEDHAFLIILITITASGFVLEGLRLYTDQPEWAAWSPVGFAFALLLQAINLDPDFARQLRIWGWWSHGVLALAFIGAIPWYKAKHMISVLGALLLRDEKPLAKLPEDPQDHDSSGVAVLSDFNIKDMFDFDACTKCGRCQEACPASAAGYPLSPRDLILDLRTANNTANSGDTPIEMVISEETLWACRSCGACQEVCPVGIEHPSKIVRMRRALVDQGRIDPMLQTTFAALGDTGNSFGEPAKKRAAWTNELDFEVKDIREQPAEYLWFVGDYASYDPRNQTVSRTVARLFKAANIDFALLHEGEHSAGNDVRRAGEEGLYSLLAEHNLQQMDAAQPFKRIITTDPHSYNTIRNEYPEYQDVAEIEHYSTVLARLLREGHLKVTKPLNRRVTFHDPCHLGRLNGGYDAPREVLELIGCEIVEMPRNRDNSFCCGAGGGRIWLPDQPGEKPSENRMHEAADLAEVDAFITCCPKDLNMFEDANKTSNHSGNFSVDDLAELVADAVELDKLSSEDLPALVKQIVEKSSHLIADAVMQKLDQRDAFVHTETPQNASAIAALAAPPTATTAPAITPSADSTSKVQTSDNAAPQQTETTSQDADQSAKQHTGLTPAQAKQTPDQPVREPKSPDTKPAQTKPLRTMSWDNPAPVSAPEIEAYDRPEKPKYRILVAVKHVGVLNDGFAISAQNALPSDAFDYKINEWDEAAMEEALLISEKIGDCEIVAVTVGDESADATLRKAMAMGADRGVRVWHETLQDADPIIIARALSGIATSENPDLFLTGVQSADLGHGSTGTVLAGILGQPHTASVIKCDWDGAGHISLTRELEGGVQHEFEIAIPAVISIQTGANQPRYATMRMIKQAKKKPIAVVDGANIDDGSSGHSIRRMYEPETQQAAMLDGDANEMAAFIIEKVSKAGGE